MKNVTQIQANKGGPAAVAATGHTIVLVEDDESNLEALQMLLQAEMTCHVLPFKSAEELLFNLEAVISSHPALFLIDYLLSEMTGLDLYDQLYCIEALCQTPVLIITAASSPDLLYAIEQRQLPIIYKPFELDQLMATVSHMVAL